MKVKEVQENVKEKKKSSLYDWDKEFVVNTSDSPILVTNHDSLLEEHNPDTLLFN